MTKASTLWITSTASVPPLLSFTSNATRLITDRPTSVSIASTLIYNPYWTTTGASVLATGR